MASKIFDLTGKNVLVMGLGLHGGGVGTIQFLAKHGASITVTDLRTRKILAPSLKKLKYLKNIKYILGEHRNSDIVNADLIVKNPGVKPNSPQIMLAKKHKIPVTTDLGIFFKSSPAMIIGVTGTRGKSTTSFLISEFLKKGTKKQVHLGGNIRKSVLEFLETIKKEDLVVLELSSFQLEYLAPEKISPHIAVFTNIQRDHLNWHKNMADYIRAKKNIFKFQTKKDFLIANPDDPKVKNLARSAKSKVILPRLDKKFKVIVDQKFGGHYESSVALAIATARQFNVSDKVIAKVLGNFRSLEGRGEEVAKINGIRFISDTTATIPDATIAALKRFRPLAKKLIVIAGGQDKNLEFGEMIKALKKYADHIIFLPGTATDRIRHKVTITDFPPIFDAKNMRDAVRRAWQIAKSGDVVLLSPGAASFGLFLNEFDRGAKFVKEIKGQRDVFRRR